MATLTSHAVCGEDRRPILGLRPRRIRRTARGWRKGPPRAPQPLTRPAASPAARPGDAVGRHGTTDMAKLRRALNHITRSRPDACPRCNAKGADFLQMAWK
ncbi:hypothetical protein NDU88_003729 [Pleurodeles waltl]|uniref:Uncharacterized protein n=1 Tax=Pleurodeles waltl TaxID=8319 RepID=A0AAV7QCK1_PLEWA|nr:hypothetical protein NDU88_003729 [Pleurodeles waltl]